MKIISFELTMPNKGSWNGKWTGEDRKYFIIRKFDNKTADKIMRGAKKYPIYEGIFIKRVVGETPLRKDHYYSWDDGWGANVCVEQINGIEANKRRKLSSGFFGYDWMVDSIVQFDEILNSKQIHELKTNKYESTINL